MLPELLETTNLFYLLHRIDIDLAKQRQLAGCPFCGGPLHHSNYKRKPRGGPETLPEDICIRLSFCCGKERCRRRTLPSSTLFMDRRVYFKGVILIILTLRQNCPRKNSKARLIRMFGISRKTINRWLVFFRNIFPASGQWQRLRGMISPEVRSNQLPGELVCYFLNHVKSAESAMIGCLCFLSTN